MTLLTVCQAVANDAGFDAPASILGNTDETAIQLLALANKAGKLIAKKPWSRLQREHTFTTQIGVEAYVPPTDLGWFVDDTAWDRSSYWQLRGSISPQEWQARKSGVMAQSPRSRFRFQLNLIYIDPVPAAEFDAVIEYVSDKWVLANDGLRYAAFQTDGDGVLFPEILLQLDLTWRFLARKGLAYIEEKDEAERQIELAIGRDVPSVPTNLAGDRRTDWPPLPTRPVTGFGP